MLIFLLGIIIGSFLNVCIHRIPNNQSILFPASHCPTCHADLRWWHLVPVLSYMFLKGRCAQCAGKISFRYPLVELLNGLLYLLVYQSLGLTWSTLTGCFLASVLLTISFIDFDLYIIPNKIVLFAFVMSIPLNWLTANLTWIDMLLGLVAGGGVLLLIAILSRGGIGGGDIKLMGTMGLYLGWQKVLLSLFLGSLFGSIVGVVLILFFGKGRKSKIPFGPCLAAGTLAVYLWGPQVFTWYWNLII